MNFFLLLLVSVSVLSNSVRGQACDGVLDPDNPLVTKLDFTKSTVTINNLHNDTNGEIRYSGEL